MIPTALEILQKDESGVYSEQDIVHAMKEFAKLHCEEQVKQISEKVKTKEDVAIFAEGTYITQIVDKDSIINAYSLSNIK